MATITQSKTKNIQKKHGEYHVGKFNDNFKLCKKEIARKKIVKHISETGENKGSILTLPHVECIIEKMLLKKVSSNFTFLGVEKDIDTYNQMFSFIANNKLGSKIHPRFAELGEIINTSCSNEYTHLILDYCGFISKLWVDIKTVLEKDIVKLNGIIAITINKRFHNNEFTDKLRSLYPYDKETNTISKTPSEHILRTLIEKTAGLRYQILETFDYRDPKGEYNNGANMLLMVIKRVW